MNRIYKLFFLAALSFLFAFTNLAPPSFSQSSLNACFQSAAAATECAQAGLISPQSAANAVKSSLSLPTPVNPFPLLPSKEVVAVVGGVAALHYLKPSDMSQLKESAPTVSPKWYLGNWRAKNTSGTYSGVVNQTIPIEPAGYCCGWGFAMFSFPNRTYVFQVNMYTLPETISYEAMPDSPAPAGTPDYSQVSNDKMYALAAAAAAAAANNTANSDQDRIAAAAAAAAAAGLVPSSSPDYQQAQDALASANTAASALAAAAAADKLDAPAKLPVKTFTGSTNFLVYAVGAFASKFPFDIIYGSSPQIAATCPSLTLFYYRWEMCFLMPLFMAIRWIIFISISTKVILEF